VYGGSNAAGSPKAMANSYRPDLTNYRLLQSRNQVMTIKNKNALPIIFPTSSKVLKSKIIPENPILTSNSLWEGITGTKNLVQSNVPFSYSTENIKTLISLNGQTAQKINSGQDAVINIS
ncbi:YfhO family protein, partial [Oenococcus oeni]